MLLYLLRHGDADSPPALADHERPLSMRGQKEIETVARFLTKTNTTINTIITSPLVRARETGSIVQQSLRTREVLTSEFLVPGADYSNLFSELSNQSEPAILLVGHEPHLSAMISILASGSETSHIEIKKGSLACLAVQKPLQRGAGVLRWIIPVSLMDIAAPP